MRRSFLFRLHAHEGCGLRATLTHIPVAHTDRIAQVEGAGHAVEVGIKGKVDETLPWCTRKKKGVSWEVQGACYERRNM